MGRSWKYVAAWLGMTLTAVTVTWLGVRLGIAPAITAEPPVAIDVDRRYTELRFGPTETVPTRASRPATATPAGRSRSASSRSRAPVRRPTPAARTAPPTRSPSAPPSAPSSASLAVSPPPSAAPDRRPRYRVPADGGSVVVAYSPSRVDLVAADPRPGHVASATRRSATLVVIRLSGPGHTSIINAYWSGGPAAQVLEDYGS